MTTPVPTMKGLAIAVILGTGPLAKNFGMPESAFARIPEKEL